ncbi:MAG: hypothetical protein V1898_03910 [Patescibacteria group bacterium]
MKKVYALWAGLIISNAMYFFVIYYLNLNTDILKPFLQWPRFFILILSFQLLLIALAVFFKFSQHREHIAWVMADSVGVIGFLYFWLWGYNPFFYANFATSFLLILILGPYLHFD